MFTNSRLFVSSICLAVLASTGQVSGADWPMWRYGPNRGAASPEQLPSQLHLQWVRENPPLQPAWGGELDVYFDKSYEPIVVGKTLFVGSSRNDSLAAIDTETGKEKWTFYAEGPVRFAPVADKGKVYFVSDDGFLYCLNAKTGELLWKFFGGLGNRKVLGNERLISAWPARGGPVLTDGKVYFAAGIWPSMGICVHAVDAETGKAIWTNDGSGHLYSSDRFIWRRNDWVPSADGLSPQGYLVVAGDKLIVPCGRSLPAVLDIETGDLLYVHAGGGGRTKLVAAIGEYFFVHGNMHFLANGQKVTSKTYIPVMKNIREGVFTEEAVYLGGITALDVRNPALVETIKPPKNKKPYVLKPADLKAEETKQKAKNPHDWRASVPNYWSMTFASPSKRKAWKLKKLWSHSFGKNITVRIKAGDTFYGAGAGMVVAAKANAKAGRPKNIWQGKVEGNPTSLIAADGKLFVVTEEGRIYCFGAKQAKPAAISSPSKSLPPASDNWRETASAIVERTGVTEGYCLLLGVGTGRLAEELLQQTDLYVIVVDPDADRINALRKRWDKAGLYGRRVAALVANPAEAGLPPYIASLIVSEDPAAAGLAKGKEFVDAVFGSLRPYGGVACLPITPAEHASLARSLEQCKLAQAKLERSGPYTLLSRPGALPNSDAWSHEYANAGNTLSTRDHLVRAPFAVLWFGGPSSMQAIAHPKAANPTPRVSGGRMYIEGPNMLHAFDAYTGRLLWKATFTGRETPKNTHLITMEDAVYLVCGRKLVALDARTGKPLVGFRFDHEADWGPIKIWKDLLIAPRPGSLLVADRRTGETIWQKKVKAPLATAVGNGILFYVEADNPLIEQPKRRGRPAVKCLLVAVDVRDGKELWRNAEGHGPELAYSEQHDVLLAAGSAAYRGKDGKRLWGEPSLRATSWPGVIVRDMIFANSQRRKLFQPISLLTGEDVTLEGPWTHLPEPLQFSRSHGCGGMVASENLLTYRSSTAAFYDLLTKSGTTNLGGFRSGCVPNLVAADGLLNVPTNIKGCSCSWPIRTSLAMVPAEDMEVWSTYSPYGWLDDGQAKGPIRRLALNFAAPGDRAVVGGTLWVDYPSIGGPSPEVKIQTVPETPKVFRYHSLRVKGEGLKWVAASGLKGIRELAVTLDEQPKAERAFTVRLHFAEPDDLAAGQRVFDVFVQGEKALESFDIVAEAGGPRRPVVKEFKGVRVQGDLKLRFAPVSPSAEKAPLICGIEVVEESKP